MKKSFMENVIFCAVIFSIGNYGVHETSCRRVTRGGEVSLALFENWKQVP